MMREQWNISIKEVNIRDAIGSVPHLRAIVKKTLFGIVRGVEQRIMSELQEQEQEEYQQHLHEAATAEAIDIPLSFTSKAAKKLKKRKRSATKMVKEASPLIDFESFSSEMCIEHNIYNYYDRDASKLLVVKVLGVGSTSPAGSTVMIRVMQSIEKKDSDLDLISSFEVPRSSLRQLTILQRECIDKIVQQDETAYLRKACPTNVHLKYWNQRFRLLSRFDEGIRLDEESWFSITPEAIAVYVTKRCLNLACHKKIPMTNVLDCFCGCGGNTIPLAQQAIRGNIVPRVPPITVMAIDNDFSKLQLLRHNAGIYGVSDGADLICADVYEFLTNMQPKDVIKKVNDQYQSFISTSVIESSYLQSSALETKACTSQNKHIRFDDLEERDSELKSITTSNEEKIMNGDDIDGKINCIVEEKIANTEVLDSANAIHTKYDLIVLSPPWGGPDYVNSERYDLKSMLPCGCGYELANLAAACSHNILYLLPKNTCVEQLKEISQLIQKPCIIELISMNNAPKLMAAYYGPIARTPNSK